MSPAEHDDLRRRIAEVPSWYQVLELAPGIVTPGYRDMRAFVPRFRFPPSLAGSRVVDVATQNGQFAFHCERLGADHVVAVNMAHWLDHDFPHWYREELRGKYTTEQFAAIDHEEFVAGFALAKDVYRSQVELRRCTVYELGARMTGQFDLAFCCNLTEHLSDPVRALESIRRSLRPNGRLILGVSCELSVAGVSYAIFHGATEPHINYWVPSPPAAERMCTLAGFVDVEAVDSFEWAPVPHPERVATVVVLHARNRA